MRRRSPRRHPGPVRIVSADAGSSLLQLREGPARRGPTRRRGCGPVDGRSKRVSSARCTRVPRTAGADGSSGSRSMERKRNSSGQVVKSEARDGDSEAGNGRRMSATVAFPTCPRPRIRTGSPTAADAGPSSPVTSSSSPIPGARCTRSRSQDGGEFHTHRGRLPHDDLIGSPEGTVVTSSNGTGYLALRPILDDFVLAMPRGAQVIYPKDAARIVGLANLGPGARVAEAGVGSGALTCSLLRAVGDDGHVYSYERRADFAEIATGNVTQLVRRPAGLVVARRRATSWSPSTQTDLDAIVLDMLAPWECIDAAAAALAPGRRPRRLRRHHDPALAPRRDAAGVGRLDGAARGGVPAAHLAPRGPGRPSGPSHERAHGVPGHHETPRRRGRAAAPAAASRARRLRRGLHRPGQSRSASARPRSPAEEPA